MIVGDKIAADKIKGRSIDLLRSEEDLEWAADVFKVTGYKSLLLIGHHESSPEAIYGFADEDPRFDAEATLVYIEVN